VPDFGQTNHIATIVFSAPPSSVFMQFLGTDQLGNTAVISDTLQGVPFASTPGQIVASGYYPTTKVAVACSAAGGVTYTLSYSGAWGTFPLYAGSLLSTLLDKSLVIGAAANAGFTPARTAVPPFGDEAGSLVFTFAATGPSGSTITLQCVGRDQSTVTDSHTFALSTVATPQVFTLPPMPCNTAVFSYVSGGASATTYAVDYLFSPPGFSSGGSTGADITTATTTKIKAVPGTLQAINVNTSAAGTIKIFDIAGAGCAGAPASGLKGTITLAGTEAPSSIPFNLGMTQGICIVTSGTPDITVTYQ